MQGFSSPRIPRGYRSVGIRVRRGVESWFTRLAASLVVFGAALAVAAAEPQATREVTDVTVRFGDGSSERFVRESAAPPATGPATQPLPLEDTVPNSGPSAGPRRSLLGVSLEGLSSGARAKMYIDVMKTARKFGSAEKPWSGSPRLDADGWPMEDFGVVFFTEAVGAGGVYRLSCVGRTQIRPVASPAKVRNLTYFPSANRTTAEIVLGAEPSEQAQLMLAFTETEGGVRDLKLLRPGYEDDAKLFTDEFLRALEPFGIIRFMDFLKTNDSAIERWSQRPRPADPTFTDQGGPYEHAIALGNRLGKDVWLNVPVGADDEFIGRLAELVHGSLRPELRCYVEYSNELWNGIFSQNKINAAAARAEVAAGDKTLTADGRETNPAHWAYRRVAKRSVAISRAFRKVYGDEAFHRRVRVVLCGQLVNPKILEEGLEYVEDYAGRPSDFFYGVAVAPYFGNKKDVVSRTDLTVDDVCAVLLERVTAGNNRHVQALHAIARDHGLRSIAYEGGVDLGQHDASVEAKVLAQHDPRAGEAVERYLRNWFESGGGEFCYFTLTSRYQRNGYWGLTDDVSNLDAPKMRAAVRVARDVPEAPVE